VLTPGGALEIEHQPGRLLEQVIQMVPPDGGGVAFAASRLLRAAIGGAP
jgi:hypothetical protein